MYTKLVRSPVRRETLTKDLPPSEYLEVKNDSICPICGRGNLIIVDLPRPYPYSIWSASYKKCPVCAIYLKRMWTRKSKPKDQRKAVKAKVNRPTIASPDDPPTREPMRRPD